MRRPFLLALAVCGLISTMLSDVLAQSSSSFIAQHVNPSSLQVVKIEEDWRLEIGVPDAGVTAPQVTTTISPGADLAGVYGIFNVNYQALDTFSPGGMQLQLWSGETPISFVRLRPEEEMQTAGEVVIWTQVMGLTSNGSLIFRIENGNSTTWGTFGGTNFLTEKASAGLPNLNMYDAMVSVDNSGISSAANRVVCLKLERVRIYTSNGQVFTVELNLHADHH